MEPWGANLVAGHINGKEIGRKTWDCLLECKMLIFHSTTIPLLTIYLSNRNAGEDEPGCYKWTFAGTLQKPKMDKTQTSTQTKMGWLCCGQRIHYSVKMKWKPQAVGMSIINKDCTVGGTTEEYKLQIPFIWNSNTGIRRPWSQESGHRFPLGGRPWVMVVDLLILW